MRSQVLSGDKSRPLAYDVAFEHGVLCDPAIDTSAATALDDILH